MNNPTQKAIYLMSLATGMPGLTRACGESLAEAAAVCFENREHRTGVKLVLSGMTNDVFVMHWPFVDDRQRRCYNDLQEATERGAYGVAILLVREATGKVVAERSKKGPGFDYWLGDKDDDQLFSGKARLEVSGILTGSAAQIRVRMTQKKKQITPSHQLAPGYVAIVEFSLPEARVEIM